MRHQGKGQQGEMHSTVAQPLAASGKDFAERQRDEEERPIDPAGKNEQQQESAVRAEDDLTKFLDCDIDRDDWATDLTDAVTNEIESALEDPDFHNPRGCCDHFLISEQAGLTFLATRLSTLTEALLVRISGLQRATAQRVTKGAYFPDEAVRYIAGNAGLPPADVEDVLGAMQDYVENASRLLPGLEPDEWGEFFVEQERVYLAQGALPARDRYLCVRQQAEYVVDATGASPVTVASIICQERAYGISKMSVDPNVLLATKAELDSWLRDKASAEVL